MTLSQIYIAQKVGPATGTTKLKCLPTGRGLGQAVGLCYRETKQQFEDFMLEKAYLVFTFLRAKKIIITTICPHVRPRKKCSVIILCMPMESWALHLFRQWQTNTV